MMLTVSQYATKALCGALALVGFEQEIALKTPLPAVEQCILKQIKITNGEWIGVSLIAAHTMYELANAFMDNAATALNANGCLLHGENLFMQKALIPAGARVTFFGDIHGMAGSVVNLLEKLREDGVAIDEQFRLLNSSHYVVFLGDYVDRGVNGVEVWYLILRLKLANPENVFLLRGNHESVKLNDNFGFFKELELRYNLDDSDLLKKTFAHLYYCLPAVLFLGVAHEAGIDFVQCCHGGFEYGVSVRFFLDMDSQVYYQAISSLNGSVLLKKLCERPSASKPSGPWCCGFSYSDFAIDAHTDFYWSGCRGFVWGQAITREFLEQSSGEKHTVHSIIRAHQHYGPMLALAQANQGVIRLWDGLVTTVFSCLRSPMSGAAPFDSCLSVTTAPHYCDWQFEPLIVN